MSNQEIKTIDIISYLHYQKMALTLKNPDEIPLNALQAIEESTDLPKQFKEEAKNAFNIELN